MRLQTFDVMVTYLIFQNGPVWRVERDADRPQEIARALSSKELAVNLARVDSRKWPGCTRQIYSVSEGVKTLEATLNPE